MPLSGLPLSPWPIGDDRGFPRAIEVEAKSAPATTHRP